MNIDCSKGLVQGVYHVYTCKASDIPKEAETPHVCKYVPSYNNEPILKHVSDKVSKQNNRFAPKAIDVYGFIVLFYSEDDHSMATVFSMLPLHRKNHKYSKLICKNSTITLTTIGVVDINCFNLNGEMYSGFEF